MRSRSYGHTVFGTIDARLSRGFRFSQKILRAALGQIGDPKALAPKRIALTQQARSLQPYLSLLSSFHSESLDCPRENDLTVPLTTNGKMNLGYFDFKKGHG
jgi:hypothetical protein